MKKFFGSVLRKKIFFLWFSEREEIAFYENDSSFDLSFDYTNLLQGGTFLQKFVFLFFTIWAFLKDFLKRCKS